MQQHGGLVLPGLDTKKKEHRILVCFDCYTMEKLPPYEGREDANGVALDGDPPLEELLKRHKHGDGEPHRGRMLRCDEKTWQRLDVRTALSREMFKEEAERAAFRDTLLEDAGVCYNKHRRPQIGCVDWHSDKKRIGNPSGHPGANKVYLCDFCLDGDTEVVTRQGTKTIRELASVGHGELLVPPTHGQWSAWRDVEVKSFGEQPLFRIEMFRGGGRTTKVVRATAEHRWVADSGEWLTTATLEPGVRLSHGQTPPLTFSGHPVEPSAVGVMQGFTFGDGTLGTGNRPAFVVLHGEKDKALLSYFSASSPRQVALGAAYTDDYAWKVTGLPRGWKSPVDLGESRSHLLGWLAGYFAADGSVDRNTGAALLSSAKMEHLQHVRDVCYVLGVTTSPIRTKLRQGFGDQPTQLHTLSISRHDLPEGFWVLEHHRLRAARATTPRRDRWTVSSVTADGQGEVFCAVVPGSERFVLADNLVTGNCPMASVVHTNIRFARGMYK